MRHSHTNKPASLLTPSRSLSPLRFFFNSSIFTSIHSIPAFRRNRFDFFVDPAARFPLPFLGSSCWSATSNLSDCLSRDSILTDSIVSLIFFFTVFWLGHCVVFNLLNLHLRFRCNCCLVSDLNYRVVWTGRLWCADELSSVDLEREQCPGLICLEENSSDAERSWRLHWLGGLLPIMAAPLLLMIWYFFMFFHYFSFFIYSFYVITSSLLVEEKCLRISINK